jgi:hypothetical protein
MIFSTARGLASRSFIREQRFEISGSSEQVFALATAAPAPHTSKSGILFAYLRIYLSLR